MSEPEGVQTEPQPEPKVITQADIDAAITARLGREQAKHQSELEALRAEKAELEEKLQADQAKKMSVSERVEAQDKRIDQLLADIAERDKREAEAREQALQTSLDSADEILVYLEANAKYLVINGAITDNFLEKMMKNSDIFQNITILVPDATKLFLSKKVFEKYIKKGGVIKVINKINIIMITINPTSPLGYEFDKSIFLNELKKDLTVPIYDLGPSDY